MPIFLLSLSYTICKWLGILNMKTALHIKIISVAIIELQYELEKCLSGQVPGFNECH
jgi:hypothetical protein